MGKLNHGIAGLLVCAGVHLACGDVARIAAVVVDASTGAPLEGVEMVGRFEPAGGWQAWKGTASPELVAVRTDREGRCRASGMTAAGRAGWLVRRVPEGYYRPEGGGTFVFAKKDVRGTWQPEDLVATVRVARVERPVPLVLGSLHRDVATPARRDLFAAGGGRIAYDLLRGDWLPPLGTGETADVEFARGAVEDLGPGEIGGTKGRALRATATLRFPGEGNGLVETAVADGAVPRIRTAPEEGYRPELTFAYERDRELQVRRADHAGRTFCFRIRTRRDERGRLVGGHYGKIYDGVVVEGAFAGTGPDAPFTPMAEPRMQYYLNPVTLDRNLEWDGRTWLGWNPATRRMESRDADRRALRARNLPLLAP